MGSRGLSGAIERLAAQVENGELLASTDPAGLLDIVTARLALAEKVVEALDRMKQLSRFATLSDEALEKLAARHPTPEETTASLEAGRVIEDAKALVAARQALAAWDKGEG